MRIRSYAAIAAICAAGAAAAAPADDMVGTWECRQPGVNYRNKPPILYVDAGTVKEPEKAAFALEIDGFVREVYGNSEVTADADGWWKITPAKGDVFMVRPEAASKAKTPSMQLRRAGATYRCLRLPPTAARGIAPSGEQGVPLPAAPGEEAPAAPNPPLLNPPAEEPAKKEP